MKNNEERFSRLEGIYSKGQLDKLRMSKIVIFGIGGVGSFCASSLARGGVGHIVICDFDKIELSNINRQEIAYESTLGMKKVDACEEMLIDINPDIFVEKFDVAVSNENVSKMCRDADFVIDAIDDVAGKIAIVKFANKNNIPIISCMGTAMRTRPDMLEYEDIYNTSVCPLCKSFRKIARKEGIQQLPVVYSKEPAIKQKNHSLGSTSFVPPCAGMMLAAYVIINLSKNY